MTRPATWAAIWTQNKPDVSGGSSTRLYPTYQNTNLPADPTADRRPGQRYGPRTNKISVGVATASLYQSKPMPRPTGSGNQNSLPTHDRMELYASGGK